MVIPYIFSVLKVLFVYYPYYFMFRLVRNHLFNPIAVALRVFFTDTSLSNSLSQRIFVETINTIIRGVSVLLGQKISCKSTHAELISGSLNIDMRYEIGRSSKQFSINIETESLSASADSDSVLNY